MIRYPLPLIVALLALLLPGLCRGGESGIVVGVLLPLTGGYAPQGLTEQRALAIAEERINADGGLRGEPIRFVVADTASDPDTAVKAAQQFVEQQRVALLMGGHSSAVAEAVAQMTVTRRFPFLITSASADRLTDPATYTPSGRRLAQLRQTSATTSTVQRALLAAPIAVLAQQSKMDGKRLAPHFSLFRISPPASEYDEGIASFLTAVARPQSAVILYERSLSGGAQAACFALTLKKKGIPLLRSFAYDPASADFRPLLTKMAELNPELIFAVSHGVDAPLLIRQAAELTLAPKLIAGVGEGFIDDGFAERAGGAGNYVFTSPLWSPHSPWPGVTRFVQEYRRRHGETPDYRGAEVYAAAMVAADALKRAVGLAPKDVTQALRETDLMTLFGPVSFGRKGATIQQNIPVPLLLQWLGDQPRIVWPEALAERPFVYPIDWTKGRDTSNW